MAKWKQERDDITKEEVAETEQLHKKYNSQLDKVKKCWGEMTLNSLLEQQFIAVHYPLSQLPIFSYPFILKLNPQCFQILYRFCVISLSYLASPH